MLRALGGFIHRWARVVALTWIVGALIAFGAALGAFGNTSLFDRLQAGQVPSVPGEALTGFDMITAASPEGTSMFLVAQGLDPLSEPVTTALSQSRETLAAVANVSAVLDPAGVFPAPTAATATSEASANPSGGATSTTTAAQSPFISTDGHALAVVVSFKPQLTDAAQEVATSQTTTYLERLGERLTAAGADRVLIGGEQQLIDEINHHVENDLRVGEAIALPLSLLVMLVVFAGVLAAGMPILGAIVSIAGGLLCLLGFSYVMDMEASVPSVVSILGLGLCIDYGLLMVSRFREETRSHRLGPDAGPQALREAIEITVDTAGRTIMFSGITVAISLAGLMFFHSSILRAVGAAGTSVVVVAVIVALTLVPALLSLAGPRLLRPGLPHRIPGLRRVVARLGDVAPVNGVFSRLATRVQRRPMLVFLGCTGLLLALAAPVLRMEVVSSGTALLPVSSQQRQLFDTIAADFPQLAAPAVRVVSRAPVEQVQTWADTLSDVPGVAGVAPAKRLGTGPDAVTVLDIRTEATAGTGRSRDVVVDVRERRPPFETWVSGDSALVVDLLDDVRRQAPLAIGVVVLATFVLLFLMTGSVLIPIKALVMNTISLGASFGVLVWIFQDGHLEGLLDFTSAGGIDENIPALVLAFAFGLAMDYEVFLLARVKETRERLLDGSAPELMAAVAQSSRHGRHVAGPVRAYAPSVNDLSVRYGLQRSGRIITSAGLIMVIVFAGFVSGQLLIIKQIGVALASSVLIDATIVRMLLVPATMTLLGERNWWAPAPLRRLYERFGISE